jgi:hypothetical protein
MSVKCELLHTGRPPSSDILASCRTEPYGDSRSRAANRRSGKRKRRTLMLAKKTVEIATTYPSSIKTIYFDRNGDVLRIEFSDDTPTLEGVSHRLMEQPINDVDLIGIYHLPARYIILRNRSNNKFIYGFHFPSCKNPGEETDQMEGEMIMRIDGPDEVTVEYPGRPSSNSTDNPFHDLIAGGALENVDVLALRSYTLLEYMDRRSGQIWCKVI